MNMINFLYDNFYSFGSINSFLNSLELILFSIGYFGLYFVRRTQTHILLGVIPLCFLSLYVISVLIVNDFNRDIVIPAIAFLLIVILGIAKMIRKGKSGFSKNIFEIKSLLILCLFIVFYLFGVFIRYYSSLHIFTIIFPILAFVAGFSIQKKSFTKL